MAAQGDLDAGALIGDKLRIVRLLGSGGMGAVYEVEHVYTHHRRALKLLHPDIAAEPALVVRFLREASAAGRIDNPHIVETFDAGRLESGQPYIVMELLRGKSLADDLLALRPYPLERAFRVLVQACEGVHAAHAAGIVHRDLKPDNLFLVGESETFVKLLDFGISKFDQALTGNQALTHEGAAMGTPYYMSPEQVRGEKDLDALADVYALGVVLYECVTGQRPFVAETLPHLSLLIAEGRYVPASQLRGDLPPEMDEVIARALASEKRKRFSSVRALAAAIQTLGSSPRPASRTAVLEPTRSHLLNTAVAPHSSAAEALTPSPTGPTDAGLSLSAPGLRLRSASRRRAAWVLGGAALLLVSATAGFALRSPEPDAARLAPDAPRPPLGSGSKLAAQCSAFRIRRTERQCAGERGPQLHADAFGQPAARDCQAAAPSASQCERAKTADARRPRRAGGGKSVCGSVAGFQPSAGCCSPGQQQPMTRGWRPESDSTAACDCSTLTTTMARWRSSSARTS